MVEVIFDGIKINDTDGCPIVVLEEIESDPHREMLIWIGETEALAIKDALAGPDSPRPKTHDLLKNIMDALSATVTAMYINANDNNIFYAKLRLKSGSEEIDIDSRPSDALAIALRYNAPIYVDENVIEKNGYIVKE